MMLDWWTHGLKRYQLESGNNIMRIWAQRTQLKLEAHESAGDALPCDA